MSLRLPNLDRFIRLQREAQRAAQGDPRLAANRRGIDTRPSDLQRKIKWWARRNTAGVARYQAQQDLIQPDWDQIQRDLRGLMEAVGESVLIELDRHLGKQALEALEAWPVDTGLSRALLYMAIDADPNSIAAVLGCGAPYTPYIRERKGLVGKKKRFLKQNPDGSWYFDQEGWNAYQAGREARGKKKAKGKPYRDKIIRPGRKIARAVGKDATERAARRAP